MTPVLFMPLIVAVVALVGVSRPVEARAGVGLVLLGVPVCDAFVRRRPVREEPA